MPPQPKKTKLPPKAKPVTARPTQSQGIREAKAEADPADPTRKVHPDSVPLEGAMQPSRFDAVVPTAEPVRTDVAKTDKATAEQDVKKKKGA